MREVYKCLINLCVLLLKINSKRKIFFKKKDNEQRLPKHQKIFQSEYSIFFTLMKFIVVLKK